MIRGKYPVLQWFLKAKSPQVWKKKWCSMSHKWFGCELTTKLKARRLSKCHNKLNFSYFNFTVTRAQLGCFSWAELRSRWVKNPGNEQDIEPITWQYNLFFDKNSTLNVQRKSFYIFSDQNCWLTEFDETKTVSFYILPRKYFPQGYRLIRCILSYDKCIEMYEQR